MTCLPVSLAYQLSQLDQQPQWLIENLWADQAVGILGGEPKCCKSFLALDIAVSVASGTPCLRTFPVSRRGPVLLFPAEDTLRTVRQRLVGICAAAQLDLRDLPIHVITAPKVLLDSAQDRQSLALTVSAIQPRILILDPFVRLHNGDENSAKDVAPLLGYLRDLQRQHHTAVLLVHHARKDAQHSRPGQSLRGSSDLHGWGDSNLYLRKTRNALQLAIEHRAAPAPKSLVLDLRADDEAVALHIISDNPQMPQPRSKPDPKTRILAAFANTQTPLSFTQLRPAAGIRAATCNAVLATLVRDGSILRTHDNRYQLPTSTPILSGETQTGSAGAQPVQG